MNVRYNDGETLWTHSVNGTVASELPTPFGHGMLEETRALFAVWMDVMAHRKKPVEIEFHDITYEEI